MGIAVSSKTGSYVVPHEAEQSTGLEIGSVRSVVSSSGYGCRPVTVLIDLVPSDARVRLSDGLGRARSGKTQSKACPGRQADSSVQEGVFHKLFIAHPSTADETLWRFQPNSVASMFRSHAVRSELNARIESSHNSRLSSAQADLRRGQR